MHSRIFVSGIFYLLCLVFTPAWAVQIPPSASGMVAVDGGQLYYQQYGSNANQPIIVLHGGPGLDSSYLLPQMTALANSNNVVTFYDQRGSGKSLNFALDEHSINMPNFISDLDAVRKEFGYDKVVLVGHSWGALVAMAYATEHPQNVAGLVLVSGAPATADGFRVFIQEYFKRTAAIQPQLTKIEQSKAYRRGEPRVVEDYFRKVFSVYFYQAAEVADLTLKFTPRSAVSGRKVAEIFGATYLSNYDLTKSLKKLKVPTLVIHGKEDIVPISTAETIHKAIAGSEMLALQDCDHFPYIEKPTEFFGSLTQFMDKLVAKSAEATNKNVETPKSKS